MSNVTMTPAPTPLSPAGSSILSLRNIAIFAVFGTMVVVVSVMIALRMTRKRNRKAMMIHSEKDRSIKQPVELEPLDKADKKRSFRGKLIKVCGCGMCVCAGPDYSRIYCHPFTFSHDESFNFCVSKYANQLIGTPLTSMSRT